MHPHQGINGLIRPILASKKDDTLGLGRRKHEPAGGSEWWVKGFEKALGDVGKSGSERSSGVSTPDTVKGGAGVGGEGKFGALYSFFVSGGEMAGTVEGREEDGRDRRKGEGKKVQEEFGDVAEFMAVRDKDEKRRRRGEKMRATEEFRRVGEFMEAVEGKHRKGQKRKSDVDAEDEVGDRRDDSEGKKRKKRRSQIEPLDELESGVVHDARKETMEERMERRQQRREEKEAKRKVAGTMSRFDGHPSENEAAIALRKAEKKRRKQEKQARPATD